MVEDLIAISLATNEEIDLRVFMIAFFVALPFAIISELIVDHEKFRNFLSKFFKR